VLHCFLVTSALHRLRRAPRLLVSRLHRLYTNYAVHRDYLSHGRIGSTSTTSCAATTHLPVARVLHQLRCASRLLVSRLQGLYLNLVMRRLATRLLVGRLHCLSPCVRSLRLAARLLVVRIAPALLRLCRASGRAVSSLNLSSVGCIGLRRVPSHSVLRRDYPSRGRNGYTSLTSRVRVPGHVTRLVVDFFAYAARLGASARRAARLVARRRLLRLTQARHRLLRLRRASKCLGTSRGSSRGSSRRSSSTTLTTPRIPVPRHAARLVTRLVAPLVVDFFAYAVHPGASAHHAARRRLLHLAQARR
jgi:hypothetical protein